MKDNLILENVCKNYNEFKLDHVSFSVQKGSIMGLIGENGAGKTTIIKLILNLISKDEGNIILFGNDNSKNDRLLKEELGVVLDDSHFHDGLKASNISNMMKNIYKNWDEFKFFAYLDKFDISTKKYLKDYSKGMKIKLSLAVALSHHAKFLILDEPTSGLDPIVRDEILDIFMEFMMDEERSILISSHITTDLEKICDYITFVHKGKIALSENKDSLLNDYGILKCGNSDFSVLEKQDIIKFRKNQFGYEVLVKGKSKISKKYPKFVIDQAHLEELMLLTIRGGKI